MTVIAERGTDRRIQRRNLEAFQKMGRHTHSHYAECQGFACFPRSGEYLSLIHIWQQLPKGNRTGKAGTLKATDEAAKGEPMTETKQTSTTRCV